MITKNIKGFKKVSYNCLTLFSTVLTLAAPAAESFSKDFVDYPAKGGTVRIPQQPESILDSLERRIKLLFEDYDTKEDETQRDLKSPPMDDHRQRYYDSKNKFIDRYEKERPQLARFRESPKQEIGASNLLSSAKAFDQSTKKLLGTMEAENQQYQKAGETLLNGAAYGAKAIIDNKVEDAEAKGFFFDLIDSTKKQALEFFK